MPCVHYAPGEEAAMLLEETRSKLDNVTRMLCGVCSSLEGVSGIGVFEDIDGLDVWWHDHKRRDEQRRRDEAVAERKRQTQERAKVDAARRRAKALSKLSAEDREALGLK